MQKEPIKKDPLFQSIEGYTRDLIQEIRTAEGQFRHDNLTNTRCPRCGKRMLAVNGKKQPAPGLPGPGMRLSGNHRPHQQRPLSQCHKKMELLKKGGEETFVCSCGYKEKLDAFKKRREKEGAGVSKKDVRRYLNSQKDEAINNAFAQALSGIKLDN